VLSSAGFFGRINRMADTMSALGQEEQHEHNLCTRDFTKTLAEGMLEIFLSSDHLPCSDSSLRMQWMLQIKRYGR
jgi:hypothetical protein